jgi:hypothetical protein
MPTGCVVAINACSVVLLEWGCWRQEFGPPLQQRRACTRPCNAAPFGRGPTPKIYSIIAIA